MTKEQIYIYIHNTADGLKVIPRGVLFDML
jgi:hypothetical protein